MCVSKGDASRIITSGEWNENEPCVTDVEECGYNCAVPISQVREERGKLHRAIESEDFEYKQEYRKVKQILSEMKNRVKQVASNSVFDALF